MSDDTTPPPTDMSELEREVRQGRTFSLAEALGRLAGPGTMKGGSPITPQRQAQAVIENILAQRLDDSAGALRRVLQRELSNSPQLLTQADQPESALIAYCHHLLASESMLAELVRQADVEWGQTLGERPYFEQSDHPPHPDDPYTHASVRAAVTALIARMTS